MGKSRKSTIRKFEFYETITDNGIESGYVRLANTQFHSDAVMDLSANSYRVFTYMKFRAKGNKVFTYTYKSKSGTIWSVKTRILYSVTNASESCLLWKYTLNK